MPKPLSEICEAWHEKHNTLCRHHGPDTNVCECGDNWDLPESCVRPDDASCPALDEWLETPVSECIIEGDECCHLTRYDPSPAGIGLPGGFMFDCDVDSNPSKCPLKAWEDDMPSECQTGGE